MRVNYFLYNEEVIAMKMAEKIGNIIQVAIRIPLIPFACLYSAIITIRNTIKFYKENPEATDEEFTAECKRFLKSLKKEEES